MGASGSGGMRMPCGATGVLPRMGTSCWAANGTARIDNTAAVNGRMNLFIRESPGVRWARIIHLHARVFAQLATSCSSRGGSNLVEGLHLCEGLLPGSFMQNLSYYSRY